MKLIPLNDLRRHVQDSFDTISAICQYGPQEAPRVAGRLLAWAEQEQP
jgi:hypothetical protein